MTSQGDLLFNNSSFSAVNTKGTNYEDAISKTTSISFADHAADRTLGFFLSDGDPTVELDSNGNVTGLNTNSTLSSIDGVGGYNFNGTTMGRVDTSYFNTWNNFVDSNDIQLNVIGIGGGISDNGKKYLNMLASADGGKAQFVVDNAGDLDDALTQDIQVITGNALDNISGGDGQINIEGITVGNTVYTIQTFPEDGIAINGKGQLKFNFTTGEYSYSANSSEFTTDATESFKVTASDEDGDTTEFDVNINILTHEPSLVGDSLNNTFNYNPTATVIDGGDGYDTLKLVSNQHIDFSQIGNVIENIEEIDLSADGKNELRNITLQDVIEMTDDKNEIKITGTDEDKVTLSGEWKLNTTLSDSEFNVYSNEDETVKLKIQTDITDITVS
jgi:hypothetical protein